MPTATKTKKPAAKTKTKMSFGQYRALKALVEHGGELITSNRTVPGETVSGTAAAALSRAGYVTTKTKDGVTKAKSNRDGKRALELLPVA